VGSCCVGGIGHDGSKCIYNWVFLMCNLNLSPVGYSVRLNPKQKKKKKKKKDSNTGASFIDGA
jgi:hypothetical protein